MNKCYFCGSTKLEKAEDKMGMFDYVITNCPNCNAELEFQSKAGDNELKRYTFQTAPTKIQSDIIDDEITCDNCGERFIVEGCVHLFLQKIQGRKSSS